MGAVLQLLAVFAFLVGIAILPEVAWGFIRLRRLHKGVDLGPMPGGFGYWYGPRLKAGAVGLALALLAGAIAFGSSTAMGANVGDFLARLALGALGALWLHDALRWNHSWFFRPGFFGRWARGQSTNAQMLFRVFIFFFGVVLVVTALFGEVVHRP
jgi:hypothetical protein